MARDTTALLDAALQAADDWEKAPIGSRDQQAAAETVTGLVVLLHSALHGNMQQAAGACGITQGAAPALRL